MGSGWNSVRTRAGEPRMGVGADQIVTGRVICFGIVEPSQHGVTTEQTDQDQEVTEGEGGHRCLARRTGWIATSTLSPTKRWGDPDTVRPAFDTISVFTARKSAGVIRH